MRRTGLDRRIRSFAERLQREDVNMYGFLLSVCGKEKAKAYYAPMEEGQPHRMYSISKTMTGLAVGMLIDAGKLTLDTLIADCFPDMVCDATDPRVLRLTIRDMLRMATCFSKTAYREGFDDNWARSFFIRPGDHEPGTVFAYDTGNSQVLAALVERLTGKSVMEYLDERLFVPSGCTDSRFWLRDPSGCCQGGSGLCMSLRDLHRVCQCLLEGGRGLVPSWYLKEMSQKQISTIMQTNAEERYGYGWQCWRTRSGWSMYGMGGQLAIFCPEKQALMTTIADTRLDPNGVQRIYDAFFEELEPYIGIEDTDAVTLDCKVSALPDCAEVADRTTGVYCFPENNALKISTMRLMSDALVYENHRGTVTLPFQRGKILRATFPGWDETPALITAGWIAEGELRIRCFAIGNTPCGFDMLVCLRGNAVTLQSRCSSGPVTDGYQGFASGLIGEEDG